MASQHQAKRTRSGAQAENAAPSLFALPLDELNVATNPDNPAAAFDAGNTVRDETHNHHSNSTGSDELGESANNSGVRLVAAAVPFSADQFFDSPWINDMWSNTEEGDDSDSRNSLALGDSLTTANWRHKNPPSAKSKKSTPGSRRCVGWMAAATLLALVIALVALGLIAVTRDTNRSNNNNGNKSGSTAASSEALAIRVAELKVMVAQLQVAAAAATASKSELLRISQLEAVVAQLQAELNGAAEAVTHLLAAGAKRHAQVGNITYAIANPPEVPGMLTDVAAACGKNGHFYMKRAGQVVCKTHFTSKKIVAFDGARGADFGSSVATRDGIIAVGAWTAKTNGVNQGSAYVYNFGANFTLQGLQTTKIVAADGTYDDFFGCAVAVGDNGLVVVAAYGDDDASKNAGSAYLYRVSSNNSAPTLLAKLLPDEGALSFGTSVVTGADGLVVVAAPFDGSEDKGNGRLSGSVYLYRINMTLGTESRPRLLTKLLPADGAADDHFGFSIAVGGTSDSLLLVGANGDGEHDSAAGSAYVFRLGRDGTAPQLVSRIVPHDGEARDCFGCSVAIGPSGLLVIGADHQDTDKGVDAGAAYIYRLTSSDTVDFVAKIMAEDGGSEDYFAWSVAFDSCGILVVGAPHSYGRGDAGSAYFYRVSTTTDSPIRLLTRMIGSSKVASSLKMDQFGRAVAASDGIVVVAAYLDSESVSSAGAVYLYSL